MRAAGCSAVSQLGERLWEDYQAFAKRDLSEYKTTYLFVEGIAERLRPGAKREPQQAPLQAALAYRKAFNRYRPSQLSAPVWMARTAGSYRRGKEFV